MDPLFRELVYGRIVLDVGPGGYLSDGRSSEVGEREVRVVKCVLWGASLGREFGDTAQVHRGEDDGRLGTRKARIFNPHCT